MDGQEACAAGHQAVSAEMRPVANVERGNELKKHYIAQTHTGGEPRLKVPRPVP